VINTHPVYPIAVIRGTCTYPSIDEIKTRISTRIKKASFFDATALSMKEFDSSLYQNSLLLGIAAALQYIPLDPAVFTHAISQVLPSNTLKNNEKAFKLGISQIKF
jgi:Pyruvate/2-oxoacid:ferredoxin oxidoreductase gamma subunit